MLNIKIMDNDNSPIKKQAGLPLAIQKVEAILSQAFADNLIDLDEFERRLDFIQKALTIKEVTSVLHDLPENYLQDNLNKNTAPARREENKSVVSVLSSRKFVGDWITSETTDLLCVLGETLFDFREVELPPGETLISINSILSTVRVIVPPDLAVVVDVHPILGDVHCDRKLINRPVSGRPYIRVSGFAVLGEIKVKVRNPSR